MSTNPFKGFTFLGGLIVFILLIAFIRNRVVTVFLGTLLVAYLLIHVKQIIPVLFNKQVSATSLKGV